MYFCLKCFQYQRQYNNKVSNFLMFLINIKNICNLYYTLLHCIALYLVAFLALKTIYYKELVY